MAQTLNISKVNCHTNKFISDKKDNIHLILDVCFFGGSCPIDVFPACYSCILHLHINRCCIKDMNQ